MIGPAITILSVNFAMFLRRIISPFVVRLAHEASYDLLERYCHSSPTPIGTQASHMTISHPFAYITL